MSTPISDRLAPTWRRTLVDDLVELTNTLTDRASDTEARIAALEQRPECPCARLCVPESDATAPSGPTDHPTPETAQGHTVGVAEYNRGFNAGWLAKQGWLYRHR